MKILSITTSSSICGVAVLEDFKTICETNVETKLTHSEMLISVIDETLKKANIELEEIDLIGVDIGPGSFTGIRIGVATIKAFVDSLGKKAVGVNSLEALAINENHNGIICSLIDARKLNVYAQIFESKNENIEEKEKPEFINIENLIIKLQQIKGQKELAFVGDGALEYKDSILKAFPNCKFYSNNKISAKNIGINALKHCKDLSFGNIEPLYLRRTQAEEKFKKECE